MGNELDIRRPSDAAPLAGDPSDSSSDDSLLSMLQEIPPWVIVTIGVVGAAFFWSYWPALKELVKIWGKEPDYSHGYLVAPIALYALWMRQDSFPHGKVHWSYVGLIVLLLCVALRVVGGVFYINSFEGWSMILWFSGVAWLLGGWHLFKWALPSLAFLWFMIPLPHAGERALRAPLQDIATKLSCATLQCLGYPALAEGHTIHLGEEPLGVEEACSGLRIFVTIAVLAFAYMMFVRTTWWEKAVLIVSIVPIALITNSTRIVMTAVLYQFTKQHSIRDFFHDAAGWMMIPLAALLFWLVLWYMSKLLVEVEVVGGQEGIRRRAT